MADREPVDIRNLDRYGNAPLEWSRSLDALGNSARSNITFFLATCGPDGIPHTAGVGAMWDDVDLYFVSGPGTRKSRNLAANAACTLSVHLEGIDLVLEGTAARVVDPATLERLAARYRTTGWPVHVEGDAFVAPYSAPSAGPPPWHLYRLALRTVSGVATAEPHGATRWTFAG